MITRYRAEDLVKLGKVENVYFDNQSNKAEFSFTRERFAMSEVEHQAFYGVAYEGESATAKPGQDHAAAGRALRPPTAARPGQGPMPVS